MTNPGPHLLLPTTSKHLLPLVAVCLGVMLCAPPSQAQTLTVLHDFTGGADGGTPTSGLTMDRGGNFYATTSAGGTERNGAVVKLTQTASGWVTTPIYEFKGEPDGAQPLSRVVFGPDGRLYGTTVSGGGGSDVCVGGCGTVYSLAPPTSPCHSISCPWRETVLYRFAGADGLEPASGDLAFDTQGNIYGTTKYGGAYWQGGETGYGAVFQLTRSGNSWSEKVLYSFSGGNDGSHPIAGVTFDSAGNLYGTTSYGGQNESGTVYELTPSGSAWLESTVHQFQGAADGGDPVAGLILDEAGNFYGTAILGGPGGAGTVFELTPSSGGWQFNLLFAFQQNGTGESPWGNLLYADGRLYGTLGGEIDHDFGSVFELTNSGGTWRETVLHNFHLQNDGGEPVGNVVIDGSGNVYGMANLGGTYGPGLVFEITP